MKQQQSFSLHPIALVIHPEFEALRPFVCSLPQLFQTNKGRVIYRGRNELREFIQDGQVLVVKSYAIPNLVNRMAYGFLRKSKAQRSYEYAQLLRGMSIGSPAPVAWMTIRQGLLFTHSYYVSLKSLCRYSYFDLFRGIFSEEEIEHYLRLIVQTVARLHEAGMVHRDLSHGNILFGYEDQVELIDLNRIRFRKVTIEMGCQNFADRLPTTPQQRRIVAEEYARLRGCDAAQCLELLNKAYSKKT